MDDNNEQEAGFDVINAINDDDGGDLFERIYLGQTLDNIPDVPFRLIIDASVTKIDNDACYNCRLLREVVFHNKVITIGRKAFMYCSNLERIELPAGLLRLEYAAFSDCTSLQQIMIPATVHNFGCCIFEDCSSLESVVFVPRTTSIELGRSMFWGCSKLRFVTFPQNLRSIPVGFFQDCTSLTHLQIPVSVVQIEERAFCGSGVRSITIPENVHQIRRDAFRNCAFLERVIFHSTNLNLGTNIFVNCPLFSTIMIAPWLWPTLCASMKGQPDFLFKFFRHYHTKILPVQRLRRDRKRTATMVNDAI